MGERSCNSFHLWAYFWPPSPVWHMLRLRSSPRDGPMRVLLGGAAGKEPFALLGPTPQRQPVPPTCGA